MSPRSRQTPTWRGTGPARSDTLVGLSMTNDRRGGGDPRRRPRRRLGGVDKGTLPSGSTRIIDRQLAALRASRPTMFVVGATIRLLRARPPVVADDDPGCGAARRHLHRPRALAVRPDAGRRLRHAVPVRGAAAARLAAVDDADLVDPAERARLRAAVRASTRAPAQAADSRPPRARRRCEASRLPQDLRVARARPRVRRSTMIGSFENVNTPHDYARARGLIELNPKPTEDRITTDAHRSMTDADS